MSTIACPGCGLPRDAELANVPCPVCGPTPAAVAVVAPPVAKPTVPNPTQGLPADVREMNRSATQREGFPAWFGWVAVFAFGVASGAGGLLAWQKSRAQQKAGSDVARVTPNEPRSLPELPPAPGKRLEAAPLPHAAKPPPEPEPEPPPPEPKTPMVAPDRVVVIELNIPNNNYMIPFPMKKGEHVILKGKVSKLTASGLDAGAILDASGLEAAQVYIGGKIDGASVLKLNCPNGKVTFGAAVDGKSTVDINAPGGDVTFSATTTPTRPGSTIIGGSRVTITARTAELRGEINGIDTKVMVNIPASGMLKVMKILGSANVEYRVAAGKGTPEVVADSVSAAATFKKVN